MDGVEKFFLIGGCEEFLKDWERFVAELADLEEVRFWMCCSRTVVDVVDELRVFIVDVT